MRPTKRTITAAMLAAILIAICPTASALMIMAGSDYLETGEGTFLDFDAYFAAFGLSGMFPSLGTVEFEGNPTGPGLTDTIVRRVDDADLPSEGSSDTIEIEIVALSLVSTNPVDVGGSFFDVFVSLDTSMISGGQMTLTLDNETDVSGYFESFFDVFFQIDLYVAGTDFYVDTILGLPPLQMQGSGQWVSEPPPNAVIVEGPYGDLDANLHTPPPQVDDFFDFFILGDLVEEHPGVGVHVAHPSPDIPEPATLTILSLGIIALAARTRKRKA